MDELIKKNLGKNLSATLGNLLSRLYGEELVVDGYKGTSDLVEGVAIAPDGTDVFFEYDTKTQEVKFN